MCDVVVPLVPFIPPLVPFDAGGGAPRCGCRWVATAFSLEQSEPITVFYARPSIQHQKRRTRMICSDYARLPDDRVIRTAINCKQRRRQRVVMQVIWSHGKSERESVVAGGLVAFGRCLWYCSSRGKKNRTEFSATDTSSVSHTTLHHQLVTE